VRRLFASVIGDGRTWTRVEPDARPSLLERHEKKWSQA
jgi:hypothetical protein